jgi:DNA-binding NarL/FixJ family response regulator
MKKILVIEDHPQMRRNVTTILTMEGYLALGVENGKLGLAAAREHHPDMIICDVMMPELDGFGVLAALRLDPTVANIPFIFLTARGDKQDHREGMNLGADDYLAKPVQHAELMAAVEARLDRRRIQDDNARPYMPDFSSFVPLQKKLGITAREAEVMLWVAQGKSNADIAIILGMAESTTKRHLHNIFEKLGAENRQSLVVQALEVLSNK